MVPPPPPPTNPTVETHALLKLPTSFLPSPRHVSFATPGSAATSKINRHPRKVIMAYDHTKFSDAVLDRAIRTGLIEPDDEIYLVHILQQSDIRSWLSLGISRGAMLEDMPSFRADMQRQETESEKKILYSIKEDMLIAVSEVLKKHSFKHVNVEVVQGDPKESLVDYCRCINPTFLATGTHGYGKIKSSILGSVSEYLAHNSPCPVMIIKITDEDVAARKEQNEAVHSTFLQKLDKFGIHI